MRLVFLGTPPAAVPSLTALVEAGHDVARVVTRADKPVGRSGRPRAPAVKQAARELDLPVDQPTRVRTASFREALAELRPAALVVVAYGRILPRPVLDLAPHGAINVHFSLLPAYRGAAPVQWALANGDATTGVTTMRMNERMDEGDVLLQTEVAIARDEHAPELQRRLADVGAALLLETLAGLEADCIRPAPQDSSRATLAPILTPTDGEVDFELPASRIAGRVRGFDPWPGVWVKRGDRRVRLRRAAAAPERTCSAPPGTVVDLAADGLVVACGDRTCLVVSELQPEGRRAVAARDAVNGRQIVVGDRLESLR